jgi:dTMP kinase
MNEKHKEGILIALEGIDGAGKTTQVEFLQKRLSQLSPVVSKEPTDGPWGRKIRESAIRGRMQPDEELEAFIKDREDHIRTVIAPNLELGRIVILDRYFYSTIAYQGERSGNIESIRTRMVNTAPAPDMVFLLDLDPKVSIARVKNRSGVPNQFETIETLSRVRSIFNTLAENDDRVWKLDGSCSVHEIHTTILSLFVEKTLKDKRCAKPWGCDSLFCAYRMVNSCEWIKDRKAIQMSPDSNQLAALLQSPPNSKP